MKTLDIMTHPLTFLLYIAVGLGIGWGITTYHEKHSLPREPTINPATRTEQQLYKDIDENRALYRTYVVMSYIHINKSYTTITNTTITIQCYSGGPWLWADESAKHFYLAHSYITLTDDCPLKP